MKYLSICSGIEAASVAWHPLGWEPLAFSEIEAFPRAVLAHHYPDVPLHGDFTVLKYEPWTVDADVLVGGTPCQAFSVAGLRKSLDDDRGNLSLEFIKLADSIDAAREAHGRDPSIVVWENVPGVLSVKDNAFGCFLAGLAGDVTPYDPPRGKWTNAGVVDGPKRKVAWRVLDAQYFGLAQRRRRVFVVASAREGFDPAAVLLEWEGVRRDTPPRREAGQIAPTIPARSLGGGGLGTDFDCDGGVIRDWPADLAPTLYASFGEKQGLEDQHIRGGQDCLSPQLSMCLNAGGMGRCDAETETLIPTIGCVFDEVTHALEAEGFDASEDGTGRGTPLVPVAFSYKDGGNDASADLSPTLRSLGAYDANGGGQMAVAVPLQEVGKRTGVSTDDPRAGIGIGQDGDPMFTLQAGAQHGVAYPLDLRNAGRDPEKHDEQNRQGVGVGEEGDPSPTISTAFVPGVAYAFQPRIARNGRGDMGDIVNALNAQSGETGKGDAAPCVAVAFAQNTRDEVRLQGGDGQIVGTLAAEPGMKQTTYVSQHMAVRRLTPVECERLQGFPDGYTAIPWKKKPVDQCPDGPRYKALGNSMAVPVMRWIGKRISEAMK